MAPDVTVLQNKKNNNNNKIGVTCGLRLLRRLGCSHVKKNSDRNLNTNDCDVHLNTIY